jgi:Tfp pilus assembly protein PilW
MSSPNFSAARAQAGLTLVELMIAMTISLLVLATLVNVYVNLSRANDEMAKTNALIENGRFAIQILKNDLEHVGYWGGHVPQFDNLTATTVPGDVPATIPNACQAYATWTSAYKTSLIAIPLESTETLPTGAGCISFPAQRAGTDAIIVRHLETCVPGTPNCDADVAGRLYMQQSNCAAEKRAGIVLAATSNSVTLDGNASSVDGAYRGVALRITSGIGSGQVRNVTTYDGDSRTASFDTPWTAIPDNTSTYGFDYSLSTSAFPLHQRDCVGTGTPATLPVTAGTAAEKRRLISNIYYVADQPHPDRADESVPTLMRSSLDVSDGALVQMPPARLLDGIEALRIELGIDEISKTGAPADYTQAVQWVDASTKTQPVNRGDGTPDRFKRCTSADPCTAEEFMNVVAVKLYVLARSRDRTVGYRDNKTYCLGEPAEDGTCPETSFIDAANDAYKRHVFSTSVRLNNISGRRETPSS